MARTILITGGGRGIGAAIAETLGRQKCAVGVNYRSDSDAAEQTVQRVIAAGGRAIALQADVSDPKQCRSLYRQCEAQLGPVYGLVNNAGIIAQEGSFLDMTPQRLRRMLEVNVLGVMFMSQVAVKSMSTRLGGKGGVIVNISSIAATLGSPHEFVDYAASKGAVDTLTIGLGKEVASEGIRVVAVRPGLIDTDLHADSDDRNRPFRLQGNIPMKRVGRPDEVAQVVAHLLSDQASYLTATTVDVSGGR